MTIVFKSGETMEVSIDVVEEIKKGANSATGREWFLWLENDNNRIVAMVNVFDISHIKQ